MAKTVFVSIVHEDKTNVIHQIKDWNNKGLIGPIDFNFEEADKRNEGEAAVKKYLKELMDKSQVIVFIIGKDTHSHNYISWEYSYAQTKPNTKIVYMNLKGSGGLPLIFPRVPLNEFNLENFKRYV